MCYEWPSATNIRIPRAENHALKIWLIWEKPVDPESHMARVCGVHCKQLPPHISNIQTQGWHQSLCEASRDENNDGWRRTKQPWHGAQIGMVRAGWPFVCVERVRFKSSTVNFLSLLLDKSSLDQTRRIRGHCFCSKSKDICSGSCELASCEEESWEPCWTEDC